jgi:uncharacterized membrane protein
LHVRRVVRSLSAATLAFNNVCVRRGVLTGSVAQAISITVPIGVPIFLLAALSIGVLPIVGDFSTHAVVLLCLAGILQFVWGRYFNYKSTEMLGANLAGPVGEMGLVVSLVLAVWFLDEAMTVLRILGIALVFLGPVIIVRTRKRRGAARSMGAAARIEGSPVAHAPSAFRPRFFLGYSFAMLCALGFGVTPILLRAALAGFGPGGSVAGGLISYSAATVSVALLMFWPGQTAHALSVSRISARWFTVSGVFVCVSQMFRYMAFSIAPVSVVAPLGQTASMFRIIFSWMLNREHEAFDAGVLVGIFVSLVGGFALTLSVEWVLSILALPDAVVHIIRWRWP